MTTTSQGEGEYTRTSSSLGPSSGRKTAASIHEQIEDDLARVVPVHGADNCRTRALVAFSPRRDHVIVPILLPHLHVVADTIAIFSTGLLPDRTVAGNGFTLGVGEMQAGCEQKMTSCR